MKHFELWNEIRPDEKRKKEILEEILSTPKVMEMKKKNTKGFRSLAAAFVLLLGVSLAYFAGKPLWIQLAKSKNTSPVITENPKVNQKSDPDSEKPKKPSVEQEMAKTLPLANYKATPNAPALDYVLHKNAQGSMGYGPGFREDDEHMRKEFEQRDAQPWGKGEDFKVLPVFKNPDYGFVPVSQKTQEERNEKIIEYLPEFRKRAQEIAEKMNVNPKVYEESIQAVGKSCWFGFPQRFIWAGVNIQVGDSEVRIDKAKAFPGIGKWDVTTDLEKIKGSLKEELDSCVFLDPMENPKFLYNIYSHVEGENEQEKMMGLKAYEQGKTLEEAFINYYLNAYQLNIFVAPWINQEEDMAEVLMRKFSRGLDVLAYYPIISREEAVEKAIQGEYVWMYDQKLKYPITKDLIYRIDLVYSENQYEETYQPVYEILVECQDEEFYRGASEQVRALKYYHRITVPAVKGAKISVRFN